MRQPHCRPDSAPRTTRILAETRFRLRAAAYGWRIRTAQPAFEVARVVLLIPSVLIALATLGLAVCGVVGHSPASVLSAVRGSTPVMIAVLVLLFVLMPALVIRSLGNLSKIMDLAAWSEEGAHRLRRDMEIGMSNGVAYEQLRSLYEPIVDDANQHLGGLDKDRKFEWVEMEGGEGESQKYAAIALRAREDEDLNRVFGTIERGDHNRLRMLADSRQRLMRTWRRLNESHNELEDELGDNYCLAQLRLEPEDRHLEVRLDISVASYGEIVRSSDALINEFALFAYLCGPIGRRRRPSVRERAALKMSQRATLRCLPWRRRVHRAHRNCKRDLFLNPHDRAAGIGIAVVTTERKGDVTEAYLGIRSGKVGTYPATNHVVPAGMCNTYGTNYEVSGPGQRPPADYLETVMRCEFLEEWAQAKEFESNKRRGWTNHVNEAWRRRIAERVTQPLKLTGIAFDLLNLRPEVCASIEVDTHDGALNWEFDQIGVQGPLDEMGRIDPTEIVQGGAAALRLAQLSDPERRRDGPSRPSTPRPALDGGGGIGWLPAEEYEFIQRRAPILCVDLLPIDPSAGRVGLIHRQTHDGRKGWCMVGGAVLRNEDLLSALRRHLGTTLGPDFVADLTGAVPLATIEYFSEPGRGEFHDPRKHAVALTFAASCVGRPAPQGEALDFSWFERDALAEVDFGFGQGKAVELVLGRLDESRGSA